MPPAAKDPEDGRPRSAPDGEPVHESDPDLEDRKPLYRDEVPSGAAAADGPASDAQPDAQQETDQPTQITPGQATPTEDATQILPRTQRSGYGSARSDFDPSDDDDDLGDLDAEGGRLGARTKLALLITAVAAVVIVGLAIGYAVLNIGDPAATAPRPSSSAPVSAASSGSPSPDPNALLSDASMLSAAQAKGLDPDRTWRVALTQRGLDEDSAQPACLGADSVPGQPPSQQTVLRLLSSTGKKAPGALHRADAYATVEEATQAYALAAKALGSCTLTGASIDSGHVVTGLGDQAVGEVLRVVAGSKTEFRSVVLNRTGRVVNVLDVARPDEAAPVARVAAALAGVTNVECRTAGGQCATGARVKAGPPPLGGDQPGFLAVADLPQAGKKAATWAGTVPAAPDPDFSGSGCETVNWAKVDATKRAARTYLLQDLSITFGLDNMVLTQRTPKAATDLVAKVKDDLDSCAKRKLTAKVTKPEKVTGTGAANTAVTGWTATVSQKTTAGTARYRVGIVSAGTKTVFTFLNPQEALDLSDDEWDTVAVRAGERATQVK